MANVKEVSAEPRSSFLRLANEEEGKRYYYEENGVMTDEYIELRVEISKRTATGLLKFAPKKEDNIDEGLRFIERAFKDLVLGWSLDAEPNVANYNLLAAAPASWIDKTVGSHLRGVLGVEAADAESKQEDLDQTQSKESASNDD